MSNDNQATSIEAYAAEQAKDREALKTFGLALNESLVKIEKGSHNVQVSVVSLAAVIASLPETAEVDPRRVGAAISALVTGQPNAQELTQHAARYAGQILDAARKARDFIEKLGPAAGAVEGEPSRPN